ncbi:hypothetical protein [Rurimicrobium arvi]|uniref:Uncharacterized protein n=1 Tax=Rurimicrobium arvi TaxID=2049916 RepID=A0ABP8MGC1_9BACT
MEEKQFDFTFSFLGTGYEARCTIRAGKTKENHEELKYYVDFDDLEDSGFFLENEHLLSYDTVRKILVFSAVQPSEFEFVNAITSAIITLEFLNPLNQ